MRISLPNNKICKIIYCRIIRISTHTNKYKCQPHIPQFLDVFYRKTRLSSLGNLHSPRGIGDRVPIAILSCDRPQLLKQQSSLKRKNSRAPVSVKVSLQNLLRAWL